MADIFELFRKIAKKDDDALGAPEYIIAGLGNPGEKYAATRHNAGFMAMDYLSEKIGADVSKLRFKALTAITSIEGHKVLLMKPQTFMNLSGDSVREAADFYNIPPERVIVISDDVSLPVGRVRVRGQGSSGGQKGLENIILRMDSENIPRVRIGVGARPAEYDMKDWVLGKIPESDREPFFASLGFAYDAIPLILAGDIDGAMGKTNGRNAANG